LFETWDFTDPARRLFKTRGKAEESCEKHKRLWTKACEATGVRALKELFGKLPLGLPMWARKKMDRRLYAILIDNRPGKYRRRSYKNFGLFCFAHGCSFGNRYPCLACRGQGRIDAPADPPCPVEGRKYVRRIDCPACRGSGNSTKEACRQAYRKIVEAYRHTKDGYDRLVHLRREAIKKLTKDEIRAIGELGL
jgi:hypothetical protein